MNKEKIKVASTSEGHPSGKPLTEIVDYCLEKGARLREQPSNSRHPFNTYRDGYGRCTLITDICFQEILDSFTFPDFIEIGTSENPYLWDKNNNSSIAFTTFEKEEKREKERKTRKEMHQRRRERRKDRRKNIPTDD